MQLHRDRRRFAEAGAHLVLIGQGTPADAARFRRRHRIALPILADERREAYAAAGTGVAGVPGLLGPRVVARGILTAARSGTVQGRILGHPAQLGGVLVVARDGSIPFQHLAADASDLPAADELVAAARAAAGG